MTISNNRQTNRLLGFSPDARLLIVNADDFGMCNSVNEAVMRTLQNEEGIILIDYQVLQAVWRGG